MSGMSGMSGMSDLVIERAELFLVRLPLRHSFATSSHRKAHIEHVLVRLTDTEGGVGWGECASPTDPYYGPENVETCWLMLRDYLLPALVGAPWATPGDAWATGARVRGNLFAKAGLDIACWDLWARRSGQSLAAALGASATQIEAGVSLGIEETVADLLDQVGRHVADGYRRVKLKIAPGWDVAPATAVRERYPDLALQVDANGGYPTRAAADLRALDGLGLLMIEQPFAPDELLAHAAFQATVQTPVCLDESIESVADVRVALHLGAARVVNVKVSRLGGLGPARAVHDLCREHGVPVWCGGMHEFGVGRAANVAFAALPGCTLPSDVSGSDKYYEQDVVDPPVTARGGRVTVPADRPGLGYEVRADLVVRLATRTHTLTA